MKCILMHLMHKSISASSEECKAQRLINVKQAWRTAQVRGGARRCEEVRWFQAFTMKMSLLKRCCLSSACQICPVVQQASHAHPSFKSVHAARGEEGSTRAIYRT